MQLRLPPINRINRTLIFRQRINQEPNIRRNQIYNERNNERDHSPQPRNPEPHPSRRFNRSQQHRVDGENNNRGRSQNFRINLRQGQARITSFNLPQPLIQLFQQMPNIRALNQAITYINQVPQNQQEIQTSNHLTPQQIEMLPKSQHSGKQSQCSICLDTIVIGDQVTYLVCFHFYHTQCCTRWMQKSIKCPVCKIDVRKHLN